MKYITLKKVFFRFFLILATLVVLFSSVTAHAISIHQKAINDSKSKNGYFQLSDKYDEEDSNIWDFYETEDSLTILSNTYNMINTNDTISYFEFSKQSLEFIGDFKGDISLVDGADESCINQTIDDKKTTPLHSFQLSKKIIEDNNLQNDLEIGRIFTTEEYNLTNDLYIPVIMGSDYKEYFQINDCFNAYYVGQVILKCKVVGFFDKNTSIDLADNNYSLDKYVVFPLVNINTNQLDENLDLFYKILLTIKSEGYVYYDSLDNKTQQLDEIQTISDTTGFKYDIETLSRQTQAFNFWPISYNTSLVMLVISTILFIIVVIAEIINLKKKVLNRLLFTTQKEKSLFKVKLWAVITSVILVAYIMAYFITNCIYLFIDFKSLFLANIVYINLFIVVMYLISMFIIFYNINKIKIKEKTDEYI